MPKIENRDGLIVVLDECGRPYLQVPITAREDLDALADSLQKYEYFGALEQLQTEREGHRKMAAGFAGALVAAAQ